METTNNYELGSSNVCFCFVTPHLGDVEFNRCDETERMFQLSRRVSRMKWILTSGRGTVRNSPSRNFPNIL